MRDYLFWGLLLLGTFIQIKWNLRDTKAHRRELSDDKNSVGFALFSLVFIAAALVLAI